MGNRTEAEPFRLLFVCTGNTCRSPMAEVIARERIRDLGWKQIEVASAGIMAANGSPASRGSVIAAAASGLDLTDHQSTFVTQEVVDRADLILTMSDGHLPRVFELGGEDRVAVITDFAAGVGADLDAAAAGVPDPIGGPDIEYLATFQVLETLIEKSLARIEPVLSP